LRGGERAERQGLGVVAATRRPRLQGAHHSGVREGKKPQRKRRSPRGDGAQQRRVRAKGPEMEQGVSPEAQAEEEERRLRRLPLARQQSLLGRPEGRAAQEARSEHRTLGSRLYLYRCTWGIFARPQ